MWVAIIGCIAWLVLLVTSLIYFYRTSEKQDAIFAMRIARMTLDSIGLAYVHDKRNICQNEALQRQRERELKELAKTYNENFKKYGGSYDADRWLKMEE